MKRMLGEQSKPCVKCGATDRNKSGNCRPCAKATNAAWYKANKENIKANTADYYQANKENIKVMNAAWQKANLDKVKANMAAWQKANKENIKANKAAYYQENKEQIKVTVAAWQKANKENIKANMASYQKANPDKVNALAARRRSTKLQAIPAWAKTKEEKDLIDFVYWFAKEKSIHTGIPYHVDHTVPLQSDLVCGLHCFNNLRVIPASENLSKGNRTWPDMP